MRCAASVQAQRKERGEALAGSIPRGQRGPGGLPRGGWGSHRNMEEGKEDRESEPEAQPHVQGVSRGQDDPRDAEDAGTDERAAASNEYGAEAEPGESPDKG